jgi:hypothetical protein
VEAARDRIKATCRQPRRIGRWQPCTKVTHQFMGTVSGAIDDHEVLDAGSQKGLHHATRGAACTQQQHSRPGQRQPDAMLDVIDQTGAVGVVSEHPITIKHQCVDRTGQCGTRRERIGEAKSLGLEGQRHIDTIAAFAKKLLQRPNESVKGR